MNTNLISNNLYVYIPRDIVLNYQSRTHRGNNFRTIYHYKNKRRYKFNDSDISEIDVYDIKEIQKDTLYKNTFKSQKDKYYDWYYCLKEKFNEQESIYINNEKGYTKKKSGEYSQTIKHRQKDLTIPIKKLPNGRKFIINFD
tara:strand:+ start:744 stop:1169 length:426 start_codon:yes stop_codon:yes gene_type:complete